MVDFLQETKINNNRLRVGKYAASLKEKRLF